jgi:hypothetical protein
MKMTTRDFLSRSQPYRAPRAKASAPTTSGLRRFYIFEAFRGPYGYLVRFLPLTATRRPEAAEMTRGERAGGDWIIPAVR